MDQNFLDVQYLNMQKVSDLIGIQAFLTLQKFRIVYAAKSNNYAEKQKVE